MDDRYIPRRSKLYEIARPLKEYLFANNEWKLDYTAFICLMDMVSKDARAPNPGYKIPLGQAIDGINNAHDRLHQLGTNGTYHKLQAKQAICCAVMKLDDNGSLRNKKLLRALLPHKDRNCRNKWIDQCVLLLNNYNQGKSDIFFNKYDDLQRDS